MAEIQNITESWEDHEGTEVEDFIKEQLKAKNDEIKALKGKVVDSMDWDVIEGDSDNIRLSLYNENDEEIAGTNIPKGGGSDVNVSKIRIAAVLDKAIVREGGSVNLTYSYDHLDNEGNSDGIAADLLITAKRGSTVLFERPIANVAAGTTASVDISEYLLTGTVEVYVRATCLDSGGSEQVKQAYAKVEVVTLRLTSSFNIAASFNSGGYNGVVEIPYQIVGGGLKAVTLYLDGVQHDTSTISNTQQTNNASFRINTESLAPGRHNVQIVAERDNLKSESIFMDFLVAGSSTPYIGVKISFEDGRIYTADQNPDLVPMLDVAQYIDLSFQYAAYTPGSATSEVQVMDGLNLIQTVVAYYAAINFVSSFTTIETKSMALVCGATEYPFYISVAAGAIDLSEQTSGLMLKLSPNGRSNSESQPDNWGDITTFQDVDWRSSGWLNNTLKLANGAKAVVGFKPFEQDASSTGLTVEIEFRMTNVMDKSLNVIECLDRGKGFAVSAEMAACYTGTEKLIPTAEEDEHGNIISRVRPVGVEMRFASNLWLKAAFVIHPKATGQKLMELYLNGVRAKADVYAESDNWMQTNAKGITFDSTGADVEVRNVRIYNRPLTDDEVLNNYIVDRPTVGEMLSLYDKNQVMDANGVSADLLRSKGKGVFIFVRADGLDPVNAENDKGADFLVDKAFFYSPLGAEFDFVATNFNMRIQGTSSTKYPRKNYRIYLKKGSSPTLTVGGNVVSGNKYAMRPNSVAKELFCLKADFSDSSMTMNTGGAKLYEQTMRALDLLTPPQRQQKDSGLDITVRQAIDGIPCDVFSATSENGELTYYGQYNFNNEKSKSGDLFGMEGVSGFIGSCPISLESLNNSNPAAMFQAPKTGLTDWLLQYFDSGFEFNYPEDKFYNPASIKDSSKEAVADNARKTAIETLMAWIADVTPANADPDDLSTFVSYDFTRHVGDHFDVNYLLTYYLWTDYHAAVDQRVKNIIWRTWDGVIWYPTFYDGDTAMGKRNDSFLVYLYNITRDSWDEEASKYAFEGHDSYLWCLVLANLETQLRACADTLRSQLTFERMAAMYNVEQMGNWCERLYNKSGEFKYIIPQLIGVPLKNNAHQKYDYMYALTGNLEAHRTLFLQERGKLLDGRYATSSFEGEYVDFYIGRSVGGSDNIKVTSNGLYYYGCKTRNGGWIVQPQAVENNQTMTLPISVALTTNDPLFLAGASHIKVLDLTGIADKFVGQIGLNKCSSLRELLLSTQTPSSSVQLSLSDCVVLEKVDVTGQTNVFTTGSALELTNQSRLKELLAGNTSITSVTIAEGAPIERLVLPESITALTLRGLTHLTSDNLTLQGLTNVLSLIITGCPGINPLDILSSCVNVERVRIEGLGGNISLSMLLRYMNGNVGGYDSQGMGTANCRLCGEVWLDRVATDGEMAALKAYYPELTIHQCEYSHYWFADEENDPANITNEDNKTGYFYFDPDNVNVPDGQTESQFLAEHPCGYIPSGHIVLLHDLCQPVLGRVNVGTGKMEVTRLDKSDYTKTADGRPADITATEDNGQDVFVYIPRYWYKGVNNYKDATKHFFLSANQVCPRPSYTKITRATLSELAIPGNQYGGTKYSGYAVDWELFVSNNELTDESLLIDYRQMVADSSSVAYRVNVEGMKQVRFPSVRATYKGCAFTDDSGKVISYHNLTMADITNNPADFDATIGDYDFRPVPEGAKWLWFTCSIQAPDTTEVIAVDSGDLEAIEPDWIEHKPELVGAYLGYAPFTGAWAQRTGVQFVGGMRSISGKRIANEVAINLDTGAWVYDSENYPLNIPDSILNGTITDKANLCLIRGRGYGFTPWETWKNLVNLFTVWYGTRKFADLTGKRSTAGNTPTGSSNNRDFDGLPFAGANSVCKVWGIEDFCAYIVMEAVDKAFYADTTWENYFATHRGGNVVNPLTVVRQDGAESKLKGAWKGGTSDSATAYEGVARLIWGQYCDIVVKKRTGVSNTSTFDICYACVQGSPTGATPMFNSAQNVRSSPYSMFGWNSNNTMNSFTCVLRLYYQGEISNEQDLLNINE